MRVLFFLGTDSEPLPISFLIHRSTALFPDGRKDGMKVNTLIVSASVQGSVKELPDESNIITHFYPVQVGRIISSRIVFPCSFVLSPVELKNKNSRSRTIEKLPINFKSFDAYEACATVPFRVIRCMFLIIITYKNRATVFPKLHEMYDCFQLST